MSFYKVSMRDFYVFCDLFLKRCMVIWNLFYNVKVKEKKNIVYDIIYVFDCFRLLVRIN